MRVGIELAKTHIWIDDRDYGRLNILIYINEKEEMSGEIMD